MANDLPLALSLNDSDFEMLNSGNHTFKQYFSNDPTYVPSWTHVYIFRTSVFLDRFREMNTRYFRNSEYNIIHTVRRPKTYLFINDCKRQSETLRNTSSELMLCADEVIKFTKFTTTKLTGASYLKSRISGVDGFDQGNHARAKKRFIECLLVDMMFR